ncbi:related to 37S ribosomal protein PET123, mitochondrial [Saccharomycodes ludwigii]|uniref:Related to 37S ribosomal protein PET123, mitochondrial n=1 Tax=Saccharomycodes ludwigii TaxID=36035 RepID=A0A376B8H1_9ASCO|nr:related to 37S ribosomal protein PET123, mitochondrial [Saccharomycodes ludwigii]
MGKGIAKFGFKSGILPKIRPILKTPTMKQKKHILMEENLKQKNSKSGYAENIPHPQGIQRNQPPMKFIEIESQIRKTVPPPKSNSDNMTSNKSTVAQVKSSTASLRREYLASSLRKEEERLIKLQNFLEEKKQIVQERKKNEQTKLLKSSSIENNLTTPTLHDMLSFIPEDDNTNKRKPLPFMRPRTEEEEEILKLKREYNREIIIFKAKKRRLEKLLQLYHVSSNFIVTEEQLLAKIDNVFSQKNAVDRAIKFNLFGNTDLTADSATKTKTRIVNQLLGTMGPNHYVGLPKVINYMNGDSIKDNQKKPDQQQEK